MLEPTNGQYEAGLKTFLSYLKNDATYTPEGLVFLDMWGANRHAANVAFLALWVSDSFTFYIVVFVSVWNFSLHSENERTELASGCDHVSKLSKVVLCA